ncbi:hypothetical protein K466DRAFT_665632 [Polyporus arcularius HHB13444]|uniref:Homeobox domain-containing protein n=1 Tax=Polyporus arcularius HHB13444 TaxID=1314778 RepID=A0A5C3P387_9APHY|nr:hypothetical protein K466DRAFT_665632 [Polyporus arcularius HHB13444]
MAQKREPSPERKLEHVETVIEKTMHRHCFSADAESMRVRPKKPKIRLPNEAYDILNDYYLSMSPWPDEPARIALAERVKRIPGCQHYTPSHVYSYFANTRRRGERSGGRRKITYPLQEAAYSVEQELDALLRVNPDPSREVAAIWAEKLGCGAAPEYILTYAFLWARQISSQTLLKAPAQLPTPDPSLSPELQSPISQLLPRAPSEKSERPEHNETAAGNAYAEHEKARAADPVLMAALNAGTTVTMTEDECLARALQSTLERSMGVSTKMPRTFAELSVWIENSGGEATRFIEYLRMGLFNGFGLSLLS